MNNLYDADGRPLLRSELPELADKGSFEGIAEVSFYDDRVKVAGRCEHCGSHATQVLKFRPELVREECDRRDVVKVAIYQLRKNHDCPYNYDGRTDVDEFLKRLAS